MKKLYNVGIIGTGFIANEHVAALKSLEMTQIAGVYDLRKEQAKGFARKHDIPRVFDSIEDILTEKCCDAVHVVVPPSFHKEVALPFLQAGIDVFLEKPMAISSQACQQLVRASEESGGKLGINHNFKFHPAFLKGNAALADHSLGRIHHVISYWNVPLRQLSTKNFGHWMFQAPGNIVLEQAVHPLSQVLELTGDVLTLQSLPSKRQELSPGRFFVDTWQIALECERATAQLFFSVGQDFPAVGLLAICEDGQIAVDCTNNLCVIQRKTQWPEFFHAYLTGRKSASALKKQGFANIKNYCLSIAKLKPRSDAFFLSMQNSIHAFYESVPGLPTYTDGPSGAKAIQICEMISETICQQSTLTEKKSLNMQYQGESFDVLVIGGTGFIGRKVVKKLIERGKRILVASRNINMLPELFYHSQVTVVSADIADKEKMRQLIAGIPIVIHLAHGGGGDTWEALETTMVGGTRNIAEACLEHGTRRLMYIGTIASLYLGENGQIITGKTPVDSEPLKRGLYSRGKAECEHVLMEMWKNSDLPVCILRPGIVIGEGGLPFHSGVGLFNQDTYCLGWNMGHNELPFVLVEDVAEAIVLAAFTSNDVIGKAYNIVGDIRLTAREYIAELGKALGRNIQYVPQPLFKTQSIEIGKWLIKRFIQHRKVDFPSYRDLQSRGLVATFDCSDLKTDLGWQPEQEREMFLEKGIAVYRKP